MNSYSQHYHTIVIGVGGMGSAVCYELAKRGQRVLGIERFDIPSDMGSSHGYTRIIRLAYYEDPSYVMLIKRAYELWDEIEKKAGKQVLIKTGSIDAGPADSWVFKGALQSCIEHDLPHTVMSGKQINQRFPGYNFPHDLMGLLQMDGGFVLPEVATVSYVEAAHAMGAEIHGREEVLRWEPRGDGVRVVTDRSEYLADSLVITGGAWNSKLLPFLRGYAVPERQVLAWLQPEQPQYFTPENFPVFNVLVPEGRYYGFPVHSIPGFKFGKYHHFEEIVEPDTYEREPDIEDEEMLREFASRYFPRGAGPTMTLKSCMFTNSPDKHFIIDLHPDYPQVSFAAGFTGHGYKFASVIGEIMADLAQRRESRHNITLFNLARLTGQVSDLYRNMPGMHVTAGRNRLQPIRNRPKRRQMPQRNRYRGYGNQRSMFRERDRYAGPAHQRINHPNRRGEWVDTEDSRYWEAEDVKPFW